MVSHVYMYMYMYVTNHKLYCSILVIARLESSSSPRTALGERSRGIAQRVRRGRTRQPDNVGGATSYVPPPTQARTYTYVHTNHYASMRTLLTDRCPHTAGAAATAVTSSGRRVSCCQQVWGLASGSMHTLCEQSVQIPD